MAAGHGYELLVAWWVPRLSRSARSTSRSTLLVADASVKYH
ncbi:MAG: hypothetical protein U0Q12_01095 [Vicinamibacterales bacterium]